MSGTVVSKDKIEKRSKAAVFFNNLFRTKLEKDGDKLLSMMSQSNQTEVRGDTTFYYSRGGLQAGIKEKLGGDPKYVQLADLSVTYWCDVPKRLWNEFQNDGVFVQQLYSHVNELTDKLVAEWAKRAIVWERSAEEADGKGDKNGVSRACAEFEKDCVLLQKECEDVAIEDIAAFFQDHAKTFADYRRYKFKVGAKLAFTFAGLVVSIAALSTAASPAAPATLIPAIIGITVTAMSAGKQIADLAASAETIGNEIQAHLEKLEMNYKDEKGKPKKKTYKARDLASGFVGGMTGGVSEIVFPSVNSLMGLVGTHRSKLDGLAVRMHDMGNSVNALVTALDAAGTVLEHNITALNAKKGGKEADKALKVVRASMKTFEDTNKKFMKAFNTDIPKMIERIDTGVENNQKWKETLDEINQALGSKNYAVLGGLFATLALTGIGFSSGAPSNLAETVTMSVGLITTGADQLREFTPDIMEKVLG